MTMPKPPGQMITETMPLPASDTLTEEQADEKKKKKKADDDDA